MSSCEGEIKRMVFTSFARVGQEDKRLRMEILVNDLIRLKFGVEKLKKLLDLHAEKSSFPPTLADVLQRADDLRYNGRMLDQRREKEAEWERMGITQKMNERRLLNG